MPALAEKKKVSFKVVNELVELDLFHRTVVPRHRQDTCHFVPHEDAVCFKQSSGCVSDNLIDYFFGVFEKRNANIVVVSVQLERPMCSEM